MCGIAGVFLLGEAGAARQVEAEQLVGRALTRLRHRGEPQYQCEISTGKSWVIGANRLAILSRSDGKQPVQSRDGSTTLVFNGEIYNYERLSREFDVGEDRIQRWGDCAVVAEVISTGKGFERFDGMFALGAVLAKTRQGILARDLVGIKPLYWAIMPFGIAFASELKALAPEADVKEILDVLPGELLEVGLDDGRITRTSFAPVIQERYDIDAGSLLDVLSSSVSGCVNVQGDIGVYLSGGVDSAAVYALALRRGGNVKALVLDGREAVDGPFARRLVKELGGELFVGECPSEGELFDLVRDTIRIVESFEPNVVRQSSVQRFISRLAREAGVKVVLCGEGADELFCGYPEFARAVRWNELRRKFCGDLHRTQLQRVDRMSMLFTTEVRVPYLRTEIMNLVLGCGRRGRFLRRGGIGPRNKIVLREALEGVLPEWIRSREKVVLSEGVGLGGNDPVRGLFASRAAGQISQGEVREIGQVFKDWSLKSIEEAFYFSIFHEFGYSKWVGSKSRTVANTINSV